MYMRNNKAKYANYNIDDFPPNYSGQYSKEDLRDIESAAEQEREIHKNDEFDGAKDFREEHPSKEAHEKREDQHERHERHDKEKEKEKKEDFKEEKKSNSLLGNLFGGHKDGDGKKGGLLSGLFNGGDGKDGGILAGIELEDLILVAVIFFLLKDGFEDDLIIILAIILLF